MDPGPTAAHAPHTERMWSAVRLGNPAALIAWAAGVVAILGTALAAALAAGADDPVPWKPLLLTLVWMAPGVLIASARPQQAMGWLMLAVAMFFVGSGLASGYLAQAAPGAGAAWAVWFVDRGAAFLVPCALLAVVLLPDGRLPAPGWRTLMGIVVGVQSIVVACFCLLTGPAAGPDTGVDEQFRQLANPVGVLPEAWRGALDGVDLIVLQVPMLLIPVAFAHRLLRAEPRQRPRLVVLLLGSALFATTLLVGHLAWPAASDVFDVLASVLLVVVIIGTVLGPRREIEFVVHRATVFVALTLLISGAYVAATSLASAAGADLPDWGAGMVAAVVALALLPLRTRLQVWVGRLVYGDRPDAFAALTRLAESTHHLTTVQAALEEVAASVAASLRVPFVRVEASGDVATAGRRPAAAVEQRTPLRSGDRQVGEVLVALDPTRRWRTEDAALLESLGRHGGMAVHAVGLAGSLRASRQRLVETREEERRRLGRNLHDGLGPTLASVTMQLGSLRGLQPSGSSEEAQLARLEEATREALAELRRVARELRPTVLDQHGLVSALERHAEALGLELTISCETDLADVPAAVEVAAYRIGQQAIANVAAHAGVRLASLRVSGDRDEIRLAVADRGSGFEASDEGVGLSSMRERAEELGGSCEVSSGPGGTLVTAVLPLPTVRFEPAGIEGAP